MAATEHGAAGGANQPEEDSVEFDLEEENGVNDFVTVPTYGGWRVDPLNGTSVSEPFEVLILDTGEQVTAIPSNTVVAVSRILRKYERIASAIDRYLLSEAVLAADLTRADSG